jgi:rhodopsin domain-containing protein
MIIYGIETLLAGIFTCTPIAFFWNSKIHGGKCVDKTTLYYANAGISIVTDVALFFIPFIFLRRLMMPKVQKLLVMLIVSFGAL